VFREIDGDALPACQNLVEMTDVSRPHHEVDPWRSGEDSLPFLLRNATANTDLHAVALHLVQLTESREDFVLRLLANGARVEQNETGLRLVVNAPIAAQFETAGQPLAVEIVHLTAPRFDEEGSLCHSEPRRRRGIPFASALGIPRALRRSG